MDAWILTHSYLDHIGAFNGIYALGTVTIDTVYRLLLSVLFEFSLTQRDVVCH